MNLLRAGACRRHRPVLADLVECGERGPGTSAALEHLAVCRSCEEELTGIALMAAALHRAGSAYRRLPAPPPGLERPAPPPRGARRGTWSWRLQLGSLAAGTALAAVVVLPHAGLPVHPVAEEAAPIGTPAHAPGIDSWKAAEKRLATSPDTDSVSVVVTGTGTLPPRYPDAMFRPWKEVPETDATAHGFEPR